MAQIPKRDLTVSAMEERKMYACTYTFHLRGDKAEFVDTWHVTARSIGEAQGYVDSFCSYNVDISHEWDDYEVTAIILIRRGE